MICFERNSEEALAWCGYESLKDPFHLQIREMKAGDERRNGELPI